MALGDGIRRDVAKIGDAERALLRDAFRQLDTVKFFGDLVSYWDKQEEIHKSAHLAGANVHVGPGFMPWHREIVNRLEALLREVNPDLSLHYWDHTTDPRSTAGGRANLFTTDFMGSAQGDAGDPFADFESSEDAELGNGHAHIWRQLNGGSNSLSANPVSLSDNTVVTSPDWTTFNSRIQQVHSDAHGFIAGTIAQAHYSFHDPFVFLLHANLDRLYAMWQTQPGHPERLDPAQVYGTDSANPGLNGPVEPWAGNYANLSLQLRPWGPPENQQVFKTYKDPSIVAPPCYDTVPAVPFLAVENPLNEIHFNDVPTGETAARAAVFRVFSCGGVTFRVKPGFEPPAPYLTLTSGGTITVPHALVPYSEARIWFGFTGGAPNTSPPNGSVTIHCDETNQDFVFTLKGNSIARPTVAVMLALDQSGSMDDPAGSLGAKRIDVLKEAAGRFAQVIQENNGIGLIRFDTDAYPVNDPTFPGLAVTKIGPGGDFDPHRVDALNAIGAHATNLAGATSIGDGVVMARNVLSAVPAPDYQQKAMIVFTDGLENRPASIDSVAGSIDQRTFAIGLGTEAQVSTVALQKLAHNTGGYLRLTGHLTPGTDDYFRLSKFFLEILAGVTNTDIVVDPNGYIAPGDKLRIPFILNEADIDATVLVMDDLPVVRLAVETPDGDVIDTANAAALGALSGQGSNLQYYRLPLPVPIGSAGAHAGTWHALLQVDGRSFKKELGRLEREREAFVRANALGARYSVNVYSFSNLRMRARLDQTSLEPGATMTVRAVLTEYGIPVDHRAEIHGSVLRPDGTTASLVLAEIEPGVFQAGALAPIAGVYHVQIRATGVTMRGAPFTRDATFTGVALAGGDRPDPHGGLDPNGRSSELCALLECLVGEPSIVKLLERQGADPQAIARCIEAYCRHTRGGPPEPGSHERIQGEVNPPR